MHYGVLYRDGGVCVCTTCRRMRNAAMHRPRPTQRASRRATTGGPVSVRLLCQTLGAAGVRLLCQTLGAAHDISQQWMGVVNVLLDSPRCLRTHRTHGTATGVQTEKCQFKTEKCQLKEVSVMCQRLLQRLPPGAGRAASALHAGTQSTPSR